MKSVSHILFALAICAMSGPVSAAAHCDAVQGWNAQVHQHKDMGNGRVMWTWSWSAEGVADDFHLFDCADGEGLRIRARAERMTRPLPYDRREKASQIITVAANAPHFFRLANLAHQLTQAQVPTERFAPGSEPCACAAYYPGVFVPGHETRDP